jgi:thymidylate synthase
VNVEFPDVYGSLLVELLDGPHEVHVNARTSARVNVLPSGCSFVLDLSDNVLPTPGLRRVYPYVAAAELAWFLSGTKDLTWLRQHAKIWDKFTTNAIYVENAYGYRWRHHFGRDQIADAVEALRENPTDRRIYIGAWDPGQDGLGRPSINVPCPVGFSLYALGSSLHMAVTMRSLDTFVGLPYDVMDFALLLRAFAQQLGLETGTMRLTANHVHLYEAHWEMAEKCLTQPAWAPPLIMPDTPVLQIADKRDWYVDFVKKTEKVHKWPEYAPKPEVVE